MSVCLSVVCLSVPVCLSLSSQVCTDIAMYLLIKLKKQLSVFFSAQHHWKKQNLQIENHVLKNYFKQNKKFKKLKHGVHGPRLVHVPKIKTKIYPTCQGGTRMILKEQNQEYNII